MSNQETFKVAAGRNPEYIIVKKEAMLPKTAEVAVKNGKEPFYYTLQGITRTGKKSKEHLHCMRFNSGKFLKVF